MSELVIAIGDIETTGLKQEDGHRIIEIAIGCYALDTVTLKHRQIGKTWVQRINPMREIDPGAQAVHGISLADLRGMPKWDSIAPRVEAILGKTHTFVAHNAQFDAPFIALELVRVGLPIPAFEVYCTMENGRKSTSMGKVPNLGELCWAMGVDYDPESAHSAAYDVDVLAQSYFRGIARGLFIPPSL